MSSKAAQLAQRFAEGVSRRRFLGGLGQSALALIAILGGVLALPHFASGQPNSGYIGCCQYADGAILCITSGRCKKTNNGHPLVAAWATDGGCVNCYR